MLVPSKFTNLEDTTIFKMRYILSNKIENENVHEAYARTKEFFYDASDFLHALDALYVLGLINIKDNTDRIEYA